MTGEETTNSLETFSWALQGLAFGLVLVFAALVNLDLGRLYIGFSFLPVIAIYFWPLKASYSWSVVCLFILGIFHDMASDGPLGIWALCYILLFVAMGGGASAKSEFGKSFAGFILALSLMVFGAFMVGTFALGQAPNLLGLVVSAVTAVLTFPFIFWLRSVFGFTRAQASSTGMR